LKQLDRFTLIDKIGRELQSRMSYSDINVYLKGFSVDVSKPTSGTNSKWIYTKERLADEPDETILKIANELEIEHAYPFSPEIAIIGSGYWTPNHFRLFLSHLASFKERTYQLKQALLGFGISGFVAHESIEPTKEWQEEIEKALFSMDALAAIFMPGFKESNWIDQELGVAIGRNVLVIPIRKGLDPYGFIGKIQGFQAQGKTIVQVAQAIFEIIASNPKTKAKMSRCLVNLLVTERDESEAIKWISLLKQILKIPSEQLQIIQTQVPENPVLMNSPKVINILNALLIEHNQTAIVPVTTSKFDDDVPF
jgi:hypothetical protein